MRKIILIILIFSGSWAMAQSETALVKAVFLERFTRFIEWPADSIKTIADSTFVVYIIGDTPILPYLYEIYNDQTIRNQPVRIYADLEEINLENCDLLFLSSNVGNNLSMILKMAEDYDVLTMSDTEGFADRGVMINLIVQQDKIRYEINEEVVRNSSLNFSYLLLSNAKIVSKVIY